MIRKFFVLLCLTIGFTTTVMAQSMTDQQVINYARQQAAAGVSQREIATQLLRRGVTMQQLERIQQRMQQQSNDNVSASEAPAQLENQAPIRRNVNTQDGYEEAELRDEATVQEVIRESESENTIGGGEIYGHSLFTNRNLTFEPNVNLATPTNYKLGPGDEVIINIWGASENTIRQTITPEGSIQVSGLGPVHLNGMTVREANTYLQREFAKIYSGIGGQEPSSQIQLTLGNIRSIQINIVGEVVLAGTYRLSAFSSVFHALYRAGGVSRIGSLRNIKVIRNGRTVATIDVYDILMQGKMNDDIRLQEGDVIRVDTYKKLVQLEGKVRRPMYYEMKDNESLQTLLNYAGGFTGDAYKKSIRIIRKSGGQYAVQSVNEIDFGTFKMDDGDVVSVEAALDRFENRIEIRGAVYRPGIYQLDGTVNTVKALITKADGLRDDAFTSRVLLDREKDDLTHEMISIDLAALMNGSTPDIVLQKNDMLFIPSAAELKEEQRVTINGEVINPGTFLYSEGMTVEDLIVMAGGLRETAATTKVEISRRVKNPSSVTESNVLGESFTIDLADGLTKANNRSFALQPFDQVYVRRSPSYREQQNVTLQGEILFGGVYALQNKNERLSSLIERAGGVTKDAYVKGARLTRKMTDDELKRRQDVLALSAAGNDSIDLSSRDIATTYSVGIDLEEALNNKGGYADIVLREGDVIYIPEMNNTVKISGTVMYPNTVTYKNGEGLSYYINQAGGYGNRAKKSKVYVVYANGNVAKAKRLTGVKIEPGCEIIVPSKPEKSATNIAQTISMASTITSMAAMIATLFRAFK
ncbi:MAG: SLBB domain-containing protein [Bacteroidaceae bacterium]|nr:SLBB domain-containing protein [Bacteroidaceae bacterium]